MTMGTFIVVEIQGETATPERASVQAAGSVSRVKVGQNRTEC